MWEYPIGTELFSSLLYESNTLFFGSDDGSFYALEDRPDAFKAVFQPEKIEGNAQYLVVDKQITPYLTGRGFEQLDETGLHRFISDRVNDKIPSVVVFSFPIIPDDIIGSSPESGLMRQYLETGGKMVWMGDVPNYWASDSTGNFTQDATAGTKLLDVEFENATESGNYFSTTTQIGRNWGLPARLKSTSSIVKPTKGVVPLAHDEFGRISLWMKKFNPRSGSGFISARTWGWYAPIRDADLDVIHRLAVHELE